MPFEFEGVQNILPLQSISLQVVVQSLLGFRFDVDYALQVTRQLLQSGWTSPVNKHILHHIVYQYPSKLNDDLLSFLALGISKCLNVSKCDKITISGLFNALAKCSGCTELVLKECNQLMVGQAFKISSRLAPNIKVLDLEKCTALDDTMAKVILRNMTNLQHLNMSGCEGITDEVFLIDDMIQLGKHTGQKVLQKPGVFPKCSLNSVDISGCRQLSNTCIRHLCTLCGPQLLHLNMSWTKIDCTALWFLAGFNLTSVINMAVDLEVELINESGMGLHQKEVLDGGEAVVPQADNKNTTPNIENAGNSSQAESDGEKVPVFCDDNAIIDQLSCDTMEMDQAKNVVDDCKSRNEEQGMSSMLKPHNDSEGNESRKRLLEHPNDDCKEEEDQPTSARIKVVHRMDANIETAGCSKKENEEECCGINLDANMSICDLDEERGKTCVVNLSDQEKKPIGNPDKREQHSKSIPNPENSTKTPVSLFQPKLLSLDMRDITIVGYNIGKACLHAFLKANPNLESLSLSWRQTNEEVSEIIAANAKNLKNLVFTENDLMTTEGIKSICQQCTKLRSLNIQGDPFVMDCGLVPLLVRGGVKSLNLAETSITDLTLKKIASCCNETIENLNLAWCEDMTLEGVNAMVQSCHSLRRLILRQGPVQPSTVFLIADNCPLLQELNLSSVSHIDDCSVMMATVKLNHLRKLDLSWNSALTDNSTSSILKNCPLLEELLIAGIKQLSSKPFLPIIADVFNWRRSQALLRFKYKERSIQAWKDNETADNISSSDEEYEELFLASRSTTYAVYLKFLDLEYCDQVNDTHIGEVAAVCRQSLIIKDYYGQTVAPSWMMKKGGGIVLAPGCVW